MAFTLHFLDLDPGSGTRADRGGSGKEDGAPHNHNLIAQMLWGFMETLISSSRVVCAGRCFAQAGCDCCRGPKPKMSRILVPAYELLST